MKTDTSVRILLADSGSVSRGVLAALAESQKAWQICGEACDGEEAIEKAGQLKPHIVVHNRRLADNNTHAMIHDNALANLSARMNVYTCKKARTFRKHSW